MYLNIKKGAVFVSDSHYSERREEFFLFLKKVDSGEIVSSQFFLLGDMFDFISGESNYFIKKNEELISLLNKLSKNIEIVYLEGNHDYNLQKLFPNIRVIKRENQPLLAKFGDRKVSISHGDNFTPWGYNLYCKIIRNHNLLVFLNLIDFNNFISKKIYYTLIEKNICSKIKDFENLAKKRLANYSDEIVIEGHFHQGKTFETNNQLYVNIPSLCCDKKFFILNDNFDEVIL